MSFCESCGFLLPVDFKDYIILCKPCKVSYFARSKLQGSKSFPCDCEYCQRSPEPKSRQHEIITISSLFPEEEKDEEERVHWEDSNDIRDFDMSYSRMNQDWGIENTLVPDITDWAVNTSQTDWAVNTSQTDWGIENTLASDMAHWAVAQTEIKNWDDSANTNEDDWMVVSNKKASQNESKPTRREDAVSEEIRDQWTREQAEYLLRLVIHDTPDIARLSSGERRKEDGSRFYVGGVDISFIKNNQIDACACLSVVEIPTLKLVYQRMEMIELTQPYIPGFLAFREVPPLLTLFQHIKEAAPQYIPDVVMVDGNGIMHPRGFGLASQLGVLLDMPTIGVAKTLMNAQGVTDDSAHKLKKQTLTEAGNFFDLISHTSGNTIGRCLRVHDDAQNPIYVSVGHNISLDSAAWLVLETSKYRIPEPVRRADLDSREYIRKHNKTPQEFILV